MKTHGRSINHRLRGFILRPEVEPNSVSEEDIQETACPKHAVIFLDRANGDQKPDKGGGEDDRGPDAIV